MQKHAEKPRASLVLTGRGAISNKVLVDTELSRKIYQERRQVSEKSFDVISNTDAFHFRGQIVGWKELN